jgi:hypothetical protein
MLETNTKFIFNFKMELFTVTKYSLGLKMRGQGGNNLFIGILSLVFGVVTTNQVEDHYHDQARAFFSA